MPDLKTLLAAAAQREQPEYQPAFTDLADRWRVRRRRRVVLGGALVLLVGAAVTTLPFRATGRNTAATPASPPPAGVVVEVTGTLRMVGGPPGTASHGTAGHVRFRASNGVTTAATAARDGSFSLQVPPGTYLVTGTSPSYGDGAYPCSAAGPVQVTAAGLHKVEVTCSLK